MKQNYIERAKRFVQCAMLAPRITSYLRNCEEIYVFIWQHNRLIRKSATILCSSETPLHIG